MSIATILTTNRNCGSPGRCRPGVSFGSENNRPTGQAGSETSDASPSDMPKENPKIVNSSSHEESRFIISAFPRPASEIMFTRMMNSSATATTPNQAELSSGMLLEQVGPEDSFRANASLTIAHRGLGRGASASATPYLAYRILRHLQGQQIEYLFIARV